MKPTNIEWTECFLNHFFFSSFWPKADDYFVYSFFSLMRCSVFNEMKQYMGNTREYPHENQISASQNGIFGEKLCWISVMRCVSWDEQQTNKKIKAWKLVHNISYQRLLSCFCPRMNLVRLDAIIGSTTNFSMIWILNRMNWTGRCLLYSSISD